MKGFAIFFGIVLLAAGVAGFVPALSPDGKVFGVFAVDTLHNIIHVATGILAIATGIAGVQAARIFFRLFGVVYAVIAVLGFATGGDGDVMGITMNMADHFLHVAIAAVSLYLGFAPGARPDLGDRRRGPDLRAGI